MIIVKRTTAGCRRTKVLRRYPLIAEMEICSFGQRSVLFFHYFGGLPLAFITAISLLGEGEYKLEIKFLRIGEQTSTFFFYQPLLCNPVIMTRYLFEVSPNVFMTLTSELFVHPKCKAKITLCLKKFTAI